MQHPKWVHIQQQYPIQLFNTQYDTVRCQAGRWALKAHAGVCIFISSFIFYSSYCKELQLDIYRTTYLHLRLVTYYVSVCVTDSAPPFKGRVGLTGNLGSSLGHQGISPSRVTHSEGDSAGSFSEYLDLGAQSVESDFPKVASAD